MIELASACKRASLQMAAATTEQKNCFLEALASLLHQERGFIIEANQKDLLLAKELPDALLERLHLEHRIDGIIHDVEQVLALEDPVGKVFDQKTLANGLLVSKMRTPIGVIGVIYESRPNVTIDITALSIKSGNCVLLKGGREAYFSNCALIKLIQQALTICNLPAHAVGFVDASHVEMMLQLPEFIDVIIPRGSRSLQKFCVEKSSIPMILGGIGICHLFVDEDVKLEPALEVIINAKTQRPTVCNALDTLLVHKKVAHEFIPRVIDLLSQKGVCFCLEPIILESMIIDHPNCRAAKDADWDTEWLQLFLGIKVVDSLEEAILHIQRHSSGHSDGILTENSAHAKQFIATVDAAAVYVNASTRFTDGAELGLGAEVAISTQKFHARGPMGLEALTSYKWVIQGNYHIRGQS